MRGDHQLSPSTSALIADRAQRRQANGRTVSPLLAMIIAGRGLRTEAVIVAAIAMCGPREKGAQTWCKRGELMADRAV